MEEPAKRLWASIPAPWQGEEKLEGPRTPAPDVCNLWQELGESCLDLQPAHWTDLEVFWEIAHPDPLTTDATVKRGTGSAVHW